jgi:hypothetical protein
MRRVLLILTAAVFLATGRADALTIRDLIELSKAGLGDPILLALIEVDRGVFSIDTETLKQLKNGGLSDAVIIALIKSGRTKNPEPEQVPAPAPQPRTPEVIVVEHRDPPAAAPPPQPYPVPVPVYVPVPSYGYGNGFDRRRDTVTTILPTDQGLVKARVPVPNNCIKAEPVYWGFGGKLRPGSWEPPPTVVCR